MNSETIYPLIFEPVLKDYIANLCNLVGLYISSAGLNKSLI
jgi:hypothetical protein